MEIDFSKDRLIKGMNAKMKQKAKEENKDNPKPQRTFKVKKVVRYVLHLDQKKMDNRKCLSEHPFGTIKSTWTILFSVERLCQGQGIDESLLPFL